MFNGSRFFNLARKWKKEDNGKVYTSMHLRILQEVMDHYFGCIAGYCNSQLLEINTTDYPAISIALVLDEVGYYNYSIELNHKIGKTLVTLRNTL